MLNDPVELLALRLNCLAGPVPQKAGHLPILLGKVHAGAPLVKFSEARIPRVTRYTIIAFARNLTSCVSCAWFEYFAEGFVSAH